MIQKAIKSKLFNTLILFIISVFGVSAQYSEEFNLYKKKYPDAKIIRLQNETIISVQLKNNAVDITQAFLEEDLYLDESATYGSKRALNFSAFFEMESVEASSFNFLKGKYKETKVENFVEKDELDGSFHDDTKSLNFIYPNLTKGAKSKLEYSEKVKNPRFLSPFYFGDFFPIKNNKVTLIADKNINFRFQEVNTEKVNIKFTKQEKRGNNIYTWELNNIDDYEYEENIPSFQNVLPHIIPIITSYTSKNKTVNVLKDVSDLYQWYYSLVEKINTDKSDEALIALVEDLTKDLTSDLEKVKAIYYWTQNSIKYIAFEYALGGFIPREANDVFKKKYGDCKDNSSILYEMLKIAGLKGELTWIGTRKIPYTYNDVPTPIVDNHMILSYTENETTYYLDATGRYLSIEMPSSFIQGKEALISNGKDKYEIKKVPIVEPLKNTFADVTILHLDDDDIKGTCTTEISGYFKMDFFNYLEDENTITKIKELYNTKLRKGTNKFLIENVKESNKYSYDKNFIIEFSFNIKDYVKKLGDEIYINLNLNKDLVYYKTKEDRENDIEIRYKAHYNYKTILNIPEGYIVDYIPKNVEFSNDYFDSKIQYQQKENQIIYNHFITLKYLTLTPKEQKIVNSAIKKVEKNYKEIIVLKKK